MRVFSANPEVVRIGALGLRAMALVQPFWAALFVQSGAIRGVGDTRFLLLVNGVGGWLAALLALVLIECVGGGLVSVWGAYLIVAPFMAFAMWRYFQRLLVTR